MTRLEEAMMTVQIFLDTDINKRHAEVLSLLEEYKDLLDLVEREAPNILIKHLQKFHDKHG